MQVTGRSSIGFAILQVTDNWGRVTYGVSEQQRAHQHYHSRVSDGS